MMDIDDIKPISNIPLYFENENERDFRNSSNQIQPHIMFMNEGEHEDINTDSENDIYVFGQESD